MELQITIIKTDMSTITIYGSGPIYKKEVKDERNKSTKRL